EVYCKPRVDEDVAWLSNWPIGNILDAGDKVNVCIFEEEGLVVSVCGSSLEYTDDGEMEQEKNFKYNTTGKEVIGGDLETASKAAFDAGDAAARYCFIYSRLCPPSKELVGGSKCEQPRKQKFLALKAMLDTLMQPKEQMKEDAIPLEDSGQQEKDGTWPFHNIVEQLTLNIFNRVASWLCDGFQGNLDTSRWLCGGTYDYCKDLSSKPFFQKPINYITSGPIVCMGNKSARKLISAVTYTLFTLRARSWRIPSEESLREAARQLWSGTTLFRLRMRHYTSTYHPFLLSHYDGWGESPPHLPPPPSSMSAAARQPGPTMAHRVDYSLVDTMETRFRDTKRRMMTALEMVNMRVSYQVLRRERLAYEQESIQTRQDLARSEAYCRALEARVTVLETEVRRHEWQRQAADDLAVQHS
ncbi:hypothetical protein Tco_1201960, partial [Tanacetum coccineum]